AGGRGGPVCLPRSGATAEPGQTQVCPYAAKYRKIYRKKFFLFCVMRRGRRLRLVRALSAYSRPLLIRSYGSEQVKLHEKGDKRRRIGIHFAAAIQEYIQKAGLTGGPLFRPRKSLRSEDLTDRSMNPASMYLLILIYPERLPNPHKEIETAEGQKG